MTKRTKVECEKLIDQVKEALSPEPKFTRGEWHLPHFAREDHACKCGWIFVENGTTIAEVYQGGRQDSGDEYPPLEEAKANARLFCASKDIYEALEDLIQVKEWKDKNGKDEHYLKAQPVAWENARKAIDKVNNG